MGPQGSGKGTQAQLFARRHGYRILSTGDILRKEAMKGTELATQISNTMNEGGLISDELIFKVLRNHINELPKTENLILDGFPRTEKQAVQLDSVIDVTCTIYILLSVEEAVQRISGRVQCPEGHTYNTISAPPTEKDICDVDGLTLSQRKDDNEDAVRHRLAIHEKEIANVLGHYRTQQKLFTIHGDATIDEVSQEIEAKLAPYAN